MTVRPSAFFCAESAAGSKQVRAYLPRLLWSARPCPLLVVHRRCLGGGGALYADCWRHVGARTRGEAGRRFQLSVSFDLQCPLPLAADGVEAFASRDVEAGAFEMLLDRCPALTPSECPPHFEDELL